MPAARNLSPQRGQAGRGEKYQEDLHRANDTMQVQVRGGADQDQQSAPGGASEIDQQPECGRCEEEAVGRFDAAFPAPAPGEHNDAAECQQGEYGNAIVVQDLPAEEPRQRAGRAHRVELHGGFEA